MVLGAELLCLCLLSLYETNLDEFNGPSTSKSFRDWPLKANENSTDLSTRLEVYL